MQCEALTWELSWPIMAIKRIMANLAFKKSFIMKGGNPRTLTSFRGAPDKLIVITIKTTMNWQPTRYQSRLSPMWTIAVTIAVFLWVSLYSSTHLLLYSMCLWQDLALPVGKVASYADVVWGTHRKSSDIADAMHQPVVNGRRQRTAMRGGNLSLLSANWK